MSQGPRQVVPPLTNAQLESASQKLKTMDLDDRGLLPVRTGWDAEDRFSGRRRDEEDSSPGSSPAKVSGRDQRRQEGDSPATSPGKVSSRDQRRQDGEDYSPGNSPGKASSRDRTPSGSDCLSPASQVSPNSPTSASQSPKNKRPARAYSSADSSEATKERHTPAESSTSQLLRRGGCDSSRPGEISSARQSGAHSSSRKIVE